MNLSNAAGDLSGVGSNGGTHLEFNSAQGPEHEYYLDLIRIEAGDLNGVGSNGGTHLGLNTAQGLGTTSSAGQQQHYSDYQMSYQNMFTPPRDPGTMWRCRSCGKVVTNRWHHFHSHTAQRSTCPFCPATYSRLDTLRSHLRVKHPDYNLF